MFNHLTLYSYAGTSPFSLEGLSSGVHKFVVIARCVSEEFQSEFIGKIQFNLH